MEPNDRHVGPDHGGKYPAYPVITPRYLHGTGKYQSRIGMCVLTRIEDGSSVESSV